jgi:hypothetical protein
VHFTSRHEYTRVGVGETETRTVVPSGLENTNTLFDCGACITFVVWGVDAGEECDIDPKWLV